MSTVSRARTTFTVLLLLHASALVSCGRQAPNSPEDSRPDATTTAPHPPRSPLGRVENVIARMVTVDGEAATEKTHLLPGHTINTDARGEFKFSLLEHLKCQTMARSSLRVQPSADELVHWTAGSSYCITSVAPKFLKLRAGSSVTLEMFDPLFAVIVEPSAVTVKNASGVLQVSGGGESVELVQGQQVRVAEGKAPSRPEPIRVSSREREIFAELERHQPPTTTGQTTSSQPQTTSSRPQTTSTTARTSTTTRPVTTTSSSIAPSVNVALGAAVTLEGGPFFTGGWGQGQVVPAASIVDGVFLPKERQWDQGAVWWDAVDGQHRAVVLTLPGVRRIATFVVQVDDNDDYEVSYRDATNAWITAWKVPNLDGTGWGMLTRPNPNDDKAMHRLAQPIVTTALRITASGGDGWFSVSEVQAFDR